MSPVPSGELSSTTMISPSSLLRLKTSSSVTMSRLDSGRFFVRRNDDGEFQLRRNGGGGHGHESGCTVGKRAGSNADKVAYVFTSGAMSRTPEASTL